MKSRKQEGYKNSIEQLRIELHKLIEYEHFNSDVVQERSQELDALILLYYKQNKDRQALKEP